MTFEGFQQSLGQSDPPQGIPPLLQALWWDGRDDWERAQAIAQDQPGPAAAAVHAYLHRKEADEWNAGYWYRKAGKPHASKPFAEEWQDLVTALLHSV